MHAFLSGRMHNAGMQLQVLVRVYTEPACGR